MLSWTIVKKHLQVKSVKSKNTSYVLHKEDARSLIVMRLKHFTSDEKFIYNRVAIRDQKRCWGSCSSKGNLNFSYKLLFLPPCLRDYIVVHELCHLKILNHSVSFWEVVHANMSDYEIRMKLLRQLEKTVGTSVVALKKYQVSHASSNCTQCAELLK